MKLSNFIVRSVGYLHRKIGKKCFEGIAIEPLSTSRPISMPRNVCIAMSTLIGFKNG